VYTFFERRRKEKEPKRKEEEKSRYTIFSKEGSRRTYLYK
jgi:hypothetical protein